MTYDIALKLKEAGFPQRERGNVLIKVPAEPKYERPGYWKPLYSKNTKKNGLINVEWLYIPTLEELIEACEPTDNTSVGLMISKTISTASKRDKVVHGPTPLIAVANLWLALQDKQK